MLEGIWGIDDLLQRLIEHVDAACALIARREHLHILRRISGRQRVLHDLDHRLAHLLRAAFDEAHILLKCQRAAVSHGRRQRRDAAALRLTIDRIQAVKRKASALDEILQDLAAGYAGQLILIPDQQQLGLRAERLEQRGEQQ